jgi:hypothetical protein
VLQMVGFVVTVSGTTTHGSLNSLGLFLFLLQ